MTRLPLLLSLASVALWIVALFLVALREPGTTNEYTGLPCLVLGWTGLLGNPLWALPWLANVLYWVSLVHSVMQTSPGKALAFSLIAIPFGLVTLAIRSIPNNASVVVGPAFYVWLASLVVLGGTNMVRTLGSWQRLLQ